MPNDSIALIKSSPTIVFLFSAAQISFATHVTMAINSLPAFCMISFASLEILALLGIGFFIILDMFAMGNSLSVSFIGMFSMGNSLSVSFIGFYKITDFKPL
ncbi:hypothetical protein TUBRATIS_28250 [Tubulinosema ratisbonensis]|uniref:Uncharacterized protein n=1 Tax=Tubulinosema ratisbonensis TaxID=291195 RepID=A0A437AHR9_9MICR|nr:hypothetical protein TUBRATIS_28250 [Tubulinosema ratisbonensis]